MFLQFTMKDKYSLYLKIIKIYQISVFISYKTYLQCSLEFSRKHCN
jgi:hypothetical protein